MKAMEYFNGLYNKDIDNVFNLLERKFNINKYYCHKMIDRFPITNNGYIEFSLSLSTSAIRFFFVYYDQEEQKWIKNNIYNVIEDILEEYSVYGKVKDCLSILYDIDPEGMITYGGDITNQYFKLYFISDKIKSHISQLAELFNFNVNSELEDLKMIGFNIYPDKINVKLYIVYNNPSMDKILKYYPNISKLQGWLKNLSLIEIFIALLPQYEYKRYIAFPTLFNKKCKEMVQNIPETKGLFLNNNIYPTWLGFNNDTKLNTIYFRPKRDYLYQDKSEEVVFKDKEWDDYERD